MLNNMITIDNNSDRIIININLKCNSREKQLLANLLRVMKIYLNFDVNDSFKLNFFCQSFVITNWLKCYSQHFYDLDPLVKESLNIEKIEDTFIENCDNEYILKQFIDI